MAIGTIEMYTESLPSTFQTATLRSVIVVVSTPGLQTRSRIGLVFPYIIDISSINRRRFLYERCTHHALVGRLTRLCRAIPTSSVPSFVLSPLASV